MSWQPYRAEARKREIQEEQAEVSWAKAVRKHEDQAANDTDRKWIDEEPEPDFELVSDIRVSKRVKHDEDVPVSC